MPASPPNSSSKMTRLRAQTSAIRSLNGFVLVVLGCAVGALAVASAMPQKNTLAEKQKELERIQEQEQELIVAKEDAQATYQALREDPEYLELHARDRLNLYKPGEIIYRQERD